MSKRPRRRGVSIGTVVMLTLTAFVLCGMGFVLPRLGGEAPRVRFVSASPSAPAQLIAQAGTPSPSVPTAFTSVSSAPMATNPPPTSTPYAGGSFTLTAGGSVCVENKVRRSCYYSESQKYDMEEIIPFLAEEMTGDMRLVTLENLTMASGAPSSLVAPLETMDMLRAAGVNTVALGFYKAGDMGADALMETIAEAKNEKLRVAGAFETEEESDAAAQIQEIGGVRVALLHYTSPSYITSRTSKQLKETPWMLPETTRAAEDIARARRSGADVVIVSLHWGKSGAAAPSKTQRALAQELADAGADVILGAGTRVIQPIVTLTGNRADGSTGQTLCCYSLGSLLSDSRTNSGVTGMLLHMTIAVDAQRAVRIENVCYTPTYIWHYVQDGGDHYRVVNSSLPAPDGMDANQEKSKNNALKLAEKEIDQPQIPVRQTK